MICNLHRYPIRFIVINQQSKLANSNTFKCHECILQYQIKPNDQIISIIHALQAPNNEHKFQKERIQTFFNTVSKFHHELVASLNLHVNNLVKEFLKRMIQIKHLNFKLVEEWVMMNKGMVDANYINNINQMKTMEGLSKLIIQSNDFEKIKEYFNQYIQQAIQIDSIQNLSYKKENLDFFMSFIHHFQNTVFKNFDNSFRSQAISFFQKKSRLNVKFEIENIQKVFFQQEVNYYEHMTTILKDIQKKNSINENPQTNYINNNKFNNRPQNQFNQMSQIQQTQQLNTNQNQSDIHQIKANNVLNIDPSKSNPLIQKSVLCQITEKKPQFQYFHLNQQNSKSQNMATQQNNINKNFHKNQQLQDIQNNHFDIVNKQIQQQDKIIQQIQQRDQNSQTTHPYSKDNNSVQNSQVFIVSENNVPQIQQNNLGGQNQENTDYQNQKNKYFQNLNDNQNHVFENNPNQMIENNQIQVSQENPILILENNSNHTLGNIPNQMMEKNLRQFVQNNPNQIIENHPSQIIENDYNQSIGNKPNQMLGNNLEPNQIIAINQVQNIEDNPFQIIESNSNQIRASTPNQMTGNNLSQIVQHNPNQIIENNHNEMIEHNSNEIMETNSVQITENAQSQVNIESIYEKQTNQILTEEDRSSQNNENQFIENFFNLEQDQAEELLNIIQSQLDDEQVNQVVTSNSDQIINENDQNQEKDVYKEQQTTNSQIIQETEIPNNQTTQDIEQILQVQNIEKQTMEEEEKILNEQDSQPQQDGQEIECIIIIQPSEFLANNNKIDLDEKSISEEKNDKVEKQKFKDQSKDSKVIEKEEQEFVKQNSKEQIVTDQKQSNTSAPRRIIIAKKQMVNENAPQQSKPKFVKLSIVKLQSAKIPNEEEQNQNSILDEDILNTSLNSSYWETDLEKNEISFNFCKKYIQSANQPVISNNTQKNYFIN